MAVILSALAFTPGPTPASGIQILGWGLPSDFKGSWARSPCDLAAQPIKLPGGTPRFCDTHVGFGSRPRCHPSLRSMAPPGLLAQQPVLRQWQRSVGGLLRLGASQPDLRLRGWAQPPLWQGPAHHRCPRIARCIQFLKPSGPDPLLLSKS